ncbi:hypothetical protein ACFQ2M_04890 [Kitasatospora saccharophila]|uniref:hypothetical protein n=1 Tax=Kitasatospora saccharophila TaxID=407973 RepID=UPI0036303FCA
MGQQEESLSAIREAVDLYRRLVRANPDVHLPDFAVSLNNLAVHLGRLGRREAALSAIYEATDLYRTLARTDPARFAEKLQSSLDNATWLGSLP